VYCDCILCIPTQIPLRHLPSMCAENVIGRANVSTVDMKGLNTGRSGSVFMRMLNLTMMRQFCATELDRCMWCCSVDAKKARRERGALPQDRRETGLPAPSPHQREMETRRLRVAIWERVECPKTNV
jgi:hypothetical protein